MEEHEVSEDWLPSSMSPPRKKLKLQKARVPPDNCKRHKDYGEQECSRNRFENSFNITEEKHAALAKGFVARNTKKSTQWAVSNFNEWLTYRNKKFPEKKCPPKLIYEPPWDPETLSYWLRRYVVETRRSDGSKYPPSTLYQLLSGIKRHMQDIDCNAPNILDRKIPHFKELHKCIDSVFRQLRAEGVGAEVRHATVINKDEENMLWEKKVLGTATPLSLLRAVFYYNGKNFCLRGGKEHRGLKISQLSRYRNPDRYVYIENGSKNRSGGFMELHVENKVVPIYANQHCPDRCHVRLLDEYLSKVPEKARELDIFYLRPLKEVPSDPKKPWYVAVPCGENKLACMVKEMFLEVGINDKTNHSLRATGASELYRANVPEKIIQQRTGHRCLKALRTYEQTTSQQLQAVSEILSSNTEMLYEQASNRVSVDSIQPSKTPISLPAMSTMFGIASKCVINITFPSSSKPADCEEKSYELDFPEELEKSIAEVDLDLT